MAPKGRARTIAAGTDSAAIRVSRPGTIVGSLTGFTVAPVIYASDISNADNWMMAEASDVTTLRIGGLRPGRYVVSASTEHDGDAQLVDVRLGQTTNVTLRARGHAAVDVSVIDFKTRAPIQGAGCHVQSSAGGFAGQTNWSSQSVVPTDATGHVSLDDVPAGAGLVICAMPTAMMSVPSDDISPTPDSRASAQLLTVVGNGGYPSTIGVGFDWRVAARRIASVAGPAALSGIQVGDLVTSVDGVSVAGLNGAGVAALIAEHAPASAFDVAVTRGTAPLVFTVAGQPVVYQ
jgi:PDZ domain